MAAKLVLANVGKQFEDGNRLTRVLDDISLSVEPGELVAVSGPSGSGKSTFLSIAGALLPPTEGNVLIDGKDLFNLKEKDRVRLRLSKIGFIFQSANLVPYLKVSEQLLLVAKLAGVPARDAERMTEVLLRDLGIAHREGHYPANLSGGEKQRAAIARAFINDPDVILADEPTASLDSERGRQVVERLAHEVKSRQKAAIMVTHDERMLDLCDRVVYIEDGKLSENPVYKL